MTKKKKQKKKESNRRGGVAKKPKGNGISPEGERQIPIKKINRLFAFHYAVVFGFFQALGCASHLPLLHFLFLFFFWIIFSTSILL
ncbi:hypothetical protein [Algoriphagus boritolerans]|uniref:hypothetical protein n=1 Tax=Algoriphagus boritolerans TaxID=308111 RepID=UPI000B2B2E44